MLTWIAWRRILSGVMMAVMGVALGVAAAEPSWADLERVSLSTSGGQAEAECLEVAVSGDGRFVAFSSKASKLVEGDTNNEWDVFVRDREKGTTERVSLTHEGKEVKGGSGRPGISADGRFVVFVCDAGDLVPGDTNEHQDVFVRDRLEGTTERVSVSTAGEQADGDSGWYPSMTPDGRFVVFVSSANSLVPGGGNSQPEVFVRDRREGKTEMVSVAVGGEAGNSGSGWMPAISADGRFVAFSSSASNLVENDTNDASDVFVRDREKGTTERVSLSSEGKEGDGNCGFPRISADGMLVAFISEATNLVEGDTNGKQDVFIRDRTKGKTYRVSMGPEGKEGNGDSGFCAMSACGRWVAFHSAASNLVAGDENGKLDVFLLDRETGAISAISVTASGKTGDGDSVGPAAAGDGKTIAFLSFAGDLVKGDNNGQPDVFAWGTR